MSYAALLIITMVILPYGFSSIEHPYIGWRMESLRDKDELIRVTFTSPDHNLGIVKLPLLKSFTLTSVPLLFKVEDAATNQIIHQQVYQSSLLTNVGKFPFGLPTIRNSNGRRYVLVLQMIQAGTKPPIALDTTNPYVTSIHKYDRTQLSANKSNIARFILMKVSAAHQKAGWTSFAVLITVCLAYCLGRQYFVQKHILDQVPNPTFFALFLQSQMIVVILLAQNLISDGVYVVWLSLYLFLTYFGNISVRYHYLWTILLLLASPFFLFVSDATKAENASVIAFFLLCTGVGMETVWKIKSVYTTKTIF